jgi:hypothetical protein
LAGYNKKPWPDAARICTKFIKEAIIASLVLSLMLVLTACSMGMESAEANTTKDTGITDSQETISSITDPELSVSNNEWHSSAVAFLSGYLSLVEGIDWVDGSQNPDALVKFAPAHDNIGLFFYDIAGNVIDEAPFLIGEFPNLMVATQYYLYDLENNGIPVITIKYVIPECSGDFPTHIYRYIDGEYRYVGNVVEPHFYADGDGRIIVLENSYFEGEQDLRISRLLSGDLGVEMIADWKQFSWDEFYQNNPVLMELLNEPLIPINPMPQMQMDKALKLLINSGGTS